MGLPRLAPKEKSRYAFRKIQERDKYVGCKRMEYWKMQSFSSIVPVKASSSLLVMQINWGLGSHTSEFKKSRFRALNKSEAYRVYGHDITIKLFLFKRTGEQ